MNKSESKYFNTAVKMDLALISLLKEKSFDYITVSDICKAAGVNRSTFYLHYETIGDLLDETTRYLLNDFFSYFSSEVKALPVEISERSLDDLVFARDRYLVPYLRYIRDNREVFITVVAHCKTLNFESVNKHFYEKIYNPIMDRFGYPESDRKYVMSYYLNGITALVTEWIKDGCEKTIEEMCKIITVCIYGV